MEAAPTRLDLDIIEIVARAKKAGCCASDVSKELKARREARAKLDAAAGRQNLKTPPPHGETLALDRLVAEQLMFKQLKSFQFDEKSCRVANVLRLTRHAALLLRAPGEAEARVDEDKLLVAWRRAFVEELVSELKASGPGARMTFAVLLHTVRESGGLERVDAVVPPGIRPRLVGLKIGRLMDIAQRSNEGVGAPLHFYIGELVASANSSRDVRDQWCVRFPTNAEAAAGRTPAAQRDGRPPARALPLVLGLARRLFDGIEAAGVRGVRIPDLSRSVGHRNTKLIDKYVTTLVNAGLCELRKVSDGKVHSYLLFTPEAIDVYDKMTTAATIATTMRVSVKSGGVKQGGSDADFGVSERESEDEQRKPDARKLLMPPPPRLAGRIRKVHPARDAGDAAPAAKKRAAKKHTGVSPPPEDDQPARVKHSHEVKPSSIHKVHSAERQRRAAHAVATVARHGGVVARAALLIAILRQCNSQQVASVDTKTCKRLLEQLLSDGKLAAAAVDYGEDTMDVISLPSVDLQSFETRAFVAQLAQLRGTSSFGTYLDDADRGVKPYIGNRRMYKRVGAIERLENNVGVITHPSGRQPRGQALKLLMGGRRGVSYSDHRKKRTRDERREAFVERYAEVSETYRIQFAALVNRIGGPRRSLSGSDSEESSEDDEDEVQTTQGLREDTASLESRRAATALLVRRLAQFGKPLDKLERMACALATQNSDDGDDDDSDSDASVASSSSDDASEGASDDDDAALECMPTITRFDSTSSFVKRDRDSSTNAERRSEQKRLKALATKPALPEPEAASVSGVKVAPLARQIARLVAAAIASGDADALEGVDRDWIGDAVERERAKGAVGTPPAPPPREAIDAALSRLLRRGWVAHVDAPIAARLAGAEPNLVVPVGAILDASNHEISRLFGGGTLGASGFFDALREAAQSDEAFSASAPRDQPAIDVDARLLPQGGHVAVLLARASRGALTIVADDWGEPAGLPVAKKRRGLPGPRPASDAAALWVDPDAVGHHRWGSWTSTKTLRGANDEALYAVAPANDADAARMWRDVLDSAAVWCDGAAAPRTAVRAAMRRVVFVHALLGVGKTPRAIVDDRARLRLTPEIDEVETLSMLLDLVDAGVFAIRGKPPNGDARRRNRKATIFNDDDDEDEDDDDAPRS